MVANLVENAVRHNVPGGWATVDVHARAGGAEVVVANSGAPVPAAAAAGCSSRSSAWRAAATARPGPGWACRSCAPWPRRTAVRWSSSRARAAGCG